MFSPTYRFLLSSPSLLCLFDSLLLPFAWAGGVWNKVNSLINQRLTTTSGPAQPCTNTNHSEQTSFHCLPNHWAKENQFALETNFCFPDLLKFVNSVHGNLENLAKMFVKQACCTRVMTFEKQAFTVLLTILMALLWNYLGTKNFWFTPLANLRKKLHLENWPILWFYIVSEVLKSK